MPSQHNRLFLFWKELKRRNVIRVVTVYTAVSLAILELVSNISEPFGLPDWTLKLVVLILVIGLILSIILSWIYDIHPEGGMVKTEPAHKVTQEDIQKSSSRWKIASYIGFVVIVGLIILNVIPRTGRENVSDFLDKSIAVLPFQNDSPDQEMYFINGVMEEILDNLCKIEDLRVVSRSSVEQYRDEPKPIPVVAEEMDVGYILEGSGQRDGDNIRLTVQLLDGRRDQHIWSESYYREISNIFDLQSEIAQLVAGEIQAVITSEEKQLIENTPTTSLTAFDLYQRGREDLWKYRMNHDSTDLERAEDYFHEALEYDSTFAQAYAWLASVYSFKNYWKEYFSSSFLDSVNIYAGIGLSYDDKLSDAYSVRGNYLFNRGKIEEAIIEYEKAIKFNPNDYMPYFGLGELYSNRDLIKSLINYQKASQLNRGAQLPEILRNIGYVYFCAGFPDKEKYYLQEALKLDRDSMRYFGSMFTHELWLGNYHNAIDFGTKGYAKDSSNIDILYTFGQVQAILGDYKMSSMYYHKWLDRLRTIKDLSVIGMYRAGHAFKQNGFQNEAKSCLNEQINYCNQMNALGRLNAELMYTYFDLAGTYSVMGENEKALENLRTFNKKKFIPSYIVFYLRNDPIFDTIRSEPEFQQIFSDVEAKYQAEHERVRQWLEENQML